VSLTGHEVWVPAGTFWMGCNPAADPYCYPGEFDTPQHEVTLGAFAIDRTEATAAAYKVCVDAGWCAAPVGSGKLSTYGIPGREAHPVNEVTWAMAEHYCAWSGKAVGAQRLPTEAEWEMAARGSCETLVGDCALGMRTYPWGEAAPSCQLAVINPTTDIFNTANWGCLTGQTWPVGSKPAGASPYGGLDLSGNVAEWVADWYAAYTGDPQIDPQGPAVGSDRAHRGGHLAIGGWRVSWRQYLGAEKSGGTIGFRCARDF
jgi:formylglycine-generating enzyme required for sulfatase activity